MEAFFNLSHDLFCVSSLDGTVKRVNPAVRRVFGFSPEELVGAPFNDFIHPDDLQASNDNLEKLATGVASTFLECRNRCKNGEYRTIAWQVSPSPENGLLYCVGRDVTEDRLKELKAAEAGANERAMQARLKMCLEAVRMGVWEWDLVTNALVWDESMYVLYGIRREDFSGAYEAWERAVHPDDIEEARRNSQDAVRGIRPYDTHFRIVMPSGAVRHIGVIGHVTRAPDGQPTKMVGVNFDISRQMHAEAAVAAQQAKLISSAKMSSLGEMAGEIAHEINNPLSVIVGRSEHLLRMLQKPAKDQIDLKPILNDGLNKIYETSIRIAKIINGLRTFSRNAENDPKERTSLRNIIQDTLDLCAERFKYHNVNINVDLGECESVEIVCRAVQISQVLLNLLNNSYDAIERLEDKWIEVKLRSTPTTVTLSVIDSGHGIPENIQDKIMQPFFTTKEVGKGTGLGLGISKAIVEDHDGTLYYDKKSPNTRFVIEIPR